MAKQSAVAGPAGSAAGKVAWHALETAEVFQGLGASESGLDEIEVEARRLRYGPNLLPEPPRRGLLQRFLLQFHNLLIFVLLSQFLVWRILFVSTLMVMGTLGLFLWDRFHGETLELARTTAVNTLIFFQIFYLLNVRYLKAPVLSRAGLLGNRSVLWSIGAIAGLQVLFIYLPFAHGLFGTAAIPLGDWVRLLLFTVSVFFLVELEKLIFRRQEEQQRTHDLLH
jgi:magnesium-transporting ATPase (P-type)